MTTAFAHAANGDLASAFATQPFGALLALIAAVFFWAGVHAGVTGTKPWRLVRPLRAFGATIVVVSLFLGAWGYKIVVWP